MKTEFTPTKEMKQAAKVVFMAMAWTETVKPIVKNIQKRVLEENKYPYSGELVDKLTRLQNKKFAEYIKNPAESYLMAESSFLDYHKKCRELEDKAGLKVGNPDFCPLLVAEDMERKAKREFLKIMQPITKINPDDVWNLEHYKKLIDLSLNLMANFVKN